MWNKIKLEPFKVQRSGLKKLKDERVKQANYFEGL